MAREEHFDAVVVGSGFGGSVMAQRLAEGGKRVLVLERGRAYPPGSFPRSPLGMKRNFWDPSEGLHGMFDLWSFQGLDALVSSGLGGGSLIYANVLLRKDERWFVGEGAEDWPVTRADLDPHYDRAEAMLGATPYPYADETPKTRAFRGAAHKLDLDWFLPPLAVTFGTAPGEPILDAPPNLHGVTRQTCRLCGECDIGCNYGAKNTLDYTYLSAAQRAGAEIRTHAEARELEPAPGGGWTVRYVRHHEDQAAPTRTLPPTAIHADRVILAAGALGSTHFLLRNRGALPGLSARLGDGFCGNGDLLTLALRCDEVIDPGHGPVITSAVRVPDAHDGGDGRGGYIEDAGYPEWVSWMLQLLDEPGALLRASSTLAAVAKRLLGGDSDHLSAEASRLLGECRLASGVLPLLSMGRDVPDGRMTLDGDRLEVDWRKDNGSRAYFDRQRRVANQIADQLGGRFLDNPIWLLDRVITVHPLGGARMARTDREGVVDPYGRVFNHPGLHVADGAVMPGPVGANPSLTIAALADRFADAILENRPEPDTRPTQRGSTMEAPTSPPPGPPRPGATSLAFTEEMKGYCDQTESDYDLAFRAGRKAKNRLMFHLTITATDVERFIDDPNHEAEATGWVEGELIGGRRPVTQGRFNLFVDHDEGKRMFYRLPFTDPAGHPLKLDGFKEVRDDRGFDVWSDTSTLFTRILTEDETVLATGILHIHPLDFARQLTTFRVDPPTRVDMLARFGALFAGELWDAYG